MLDDKYPPSYSPAQATCSTCARIMDLTTSADELSASYKSLPKLPLESISGLKQGCCDRWVCKTCLEVFTRNPRFADYCPLCPSIHILPPSYDTATSTTMTSSNKALAVLCEAKEPPELVEDVLHFVRPSDTVPSLSILYGVLPAVIRHHNRLFSDHLLLARQTIVIPGSYYRGPSFSATPVGGEEEETKKSKLKRFQIRTKCVDLKMAEFYLEDARWSEKLAEQTWWKDEHWVRSREGALQSGTKKR